jgi:hypothetical protein
LQRSYSYYDLQYVEYIFERFLNTKASIENQKVPLILEHLGVMLPCHSNIMHYLATNQIFLTLYLQEIVSRMQVDAESYQNENILTYAYYGLLPNYFPIMKTHLKGRRAFSIALKSNNIACLELIIKMLMADKKRCYIKDIKQNLMSLLDLVKKSQTIHEFIDKHSLR